MGALTNRYVTLQNETTYGTEPAASEAAQITGEVDDESFAQNFDLLTRADIGHYGARKTTDGLRFSEGSVNCPLQLDDFNGQLIANAFGVDTFNGSATPKTHTLTETTDDSTFKSFTVRVGREDKEHTYTGMVLDSLSISANINEYVMMSYNFVGCGESSVGNLQTLGGGDPNAPAFSTEDALHFARAFVRFEDVASSSSFSTMVKSISIDINLNRDTDNASSLGNTTYAVSPPPTLREITGTIEFNRDVSSASDNEPTYDELRNFLKHEGGDSFATPALSIHLEDTAGTPNYLTLKLANVAYEAPEMNVSGRDTSTMSVSFVALYDVGSSGMAQCIIGKSGLNSDGGFFS